jgi:hypothetical protein
MKSCLRLLLLVLFYSSASAQGVAVNNQSIPPDASAVLDVSSSSKGLLIPRLTTAERNTISQPATALLIFNNDVKQFQVNVGSGSLPNWQNIVSVGGGQSSAGVWQTGGNKGLADTSFIGNTDMKSLSFKTNNILRLYIDSAQNKVGIGTSLPRTSLDIAGTDAMIVPVGTTAQRPETPVVGMIRFNATTNKLEGYTSTGWVALH